MRGTLSTAAAAAALAILCGSAAALPIDFTGYFRTGTGTTTDGGKEACFRLPGSLVWFRLGNECDTYGALDFNAKLGEVDGTTFKSVLTMAYGTQQMANWEQSAPAWRQVYVEASDIGAGLGVPALRGASLWAGKRFYKNPDVHMLDYTYWEPAQGPGAGIDGIDVGIGKFSYAIFRVGDFAGYGVNTDLGGYNPDLIGGGSRTNTVHDLRLADVPVNPGGKLTAGLNLIRASNQGGTSTYTRDVTTPVDLDNNPATPDVNVVIREEVTVDNKPGRNGLALTLSHKQDNFLGLGGFHNTVLQYAHDAALLKGFIPAGSTDRRREWMLFNHWVMEPKGTPFTMSATAGYRDADVNDSRLREFWIGARPQYHINNIWSLMSEVGYQQVKLAGETSKLAKVTLGTQFSMGRSIFSRPAIRFYATYAKWNDAAGDRVVCTGRDCNRPVPAFDGKRDAVSYGVQAEVWF